VALLILTKTGQTEEQTNESYEKIQYEIWNVQKNKQKLIKIIFGPDEASN
jgi:hypothetical protein